MRRFDKPWIVEVPQFIICGDSDGGWRKPGEWGFYSGHFTEVEAYEAADDAAITNEFVRVRYMGDSVDA